MTMDIAPSRLSARVWGRRIYWGASFTLARWRRAWNYARNRLDYDTANRIVSDCQDAAEWWPLESFDLDGVIEDALDRWEDHPELRNLALDACDRVHSKWESQGHAASAARDWALDLIATYARDQGVELKERED